MQDFETYHSQVYEKVVLSKGSEATGAHCSPPNLIKIIMLTFNKMHAYIYGTGKKAGIMNCKILQNGKEYNYDGIHCIPASLCSISDTSPIKYRLL